MASVKGRNTSPERLAKASLRELKVRYRSNVKGIDGTPDIVILGEKKLIFVHGCFWHGHQNCSKAARPQTNKDFWADKLNGNISRDKRLLRRLRKSGWQVLVIWQCQTRDAVSLKRRLSAFIKR